MRPLVVDGFVGLGVVSAWIGAVGFLRLKWALDRLHAVTFVTVACGLPLVAAGFVTDGPSIRSFKFLFTWVIMLVAGASLNQAIARAIFNRKEAGERT